MTKKIFGVLLVIVTFSILLYSMLYTVNYKPDKQVKLPFTIENTKNKCVIFFGYVGCPEICPVSLSKIGSAYKNLNDNTLQIVFIGLSDTTQIATNKFAKIFNTDFIGIKLDKDKQRELIESFNVFWSPERKKIKREAAHSPYIYFLKKDKKNWVLKNVYTKYPAKVNDLITQIESL